MKIWQVTIEIYNYEFDETEYFFFHTKKEALDKINDAKKQYVNSGCSILYDYNQVNFKHAKDIMTIEQFEELFNVNIELLLEDK